MNAVQRRSHDDHGRANERSLVYPLDSLWNFKSWKRLGKSETIVSKNSDTASKVFLFIEIDYSSFVCTFLWVFFFLRKIL